MTRLLLAATLAASVACHHSSSSTTATGPSNKVGSAKAVAASGDELAYLPVDSDFVVGIDGTTARNSALWGQLGPQVAENVRDRLATGDVAKCKLDPVNTVQSVAIAVKSNPKQVIAVIRGIDQPTFDCIVDVAKTKAQVTASGATVVVDHGAGEPKVAVSLLGGGVAVALVSNTATAAELDAVLASGTPLRGSPVFMSLYGRREANAAVWAMGRANAPMLRQLAGNFNAKTIDGTVVLTDKVTGTGRFELATPGDATNLQSVVQQASGQASAFFERIDATANGTMTQVTVVATADQIRTIMNMMVGFL